MNVQRKFDRAFQWASERLGSEAKTSLPDEFRALEADTTVRADGMDRLQKSMNAYVKWISRKGETFEDKEKGLPVAYLGRTMVTHGEELDADSPLGRCLIAFGRANERIASMQDHYVELATVTWADSVERSLTMMKEYSAARKKLESRRMGYDASTTKLQKARRDDYRIEEEMRTAKAKFEESTEDVMRRMEDIHETEGESVRDLTAFLDAELEFHERCAEELRRIRSAWPADGADDEDAGSYPRYERERPAAPVKSRSRSNTGQSAHMERLSRRATSGSIREELDEAPAIPTRPARAQSHRPAPALPSKPAITRSATYQPTSPSRENTFPQPLANMAASRARARDQQQQQQQQHDYRQHEDVFADHHEDNSPASTGSRSPIWDDRFSSPATSVGSLSRSTTSLSGGVNAGASMRKAPPPPPCRSKKPPPPIPAKRLGGEVM